METSGPEICPPHYGNIYMVCEEDEDLRETMKIIGPDRIMLGSDMLHSESHPNSFQRFQQRADLDDGVKTQILWENAGRFLLLTDLRSTATHCHIDAIG